MNEEKMSLDEATATLNRVIKEGRALSRISEILAVARQYKDFESTVESQKAGLLTEIERIEGEVSKAQEAYKAKRSKLEADYNAFDESLRSKRDKVERDYQRHTVNLSERENAAEEKTKRAEDVAKKRIAEIDTAMKQLEREHDESVRTKKAELAKLDDAIKMAKREAEALSERLRSR